MMGNEKSAPEPFVPEAGEIEPAGGIISRPPAPELTDPPTEGDNRPGEDETPDE